jgi:hypothetical protein
MAAEKLRRPVTGAQLRAARALKGLSAPKLAKLMKIGLRTIRRAEQEAGPVQITETNELIIQQLERMGIEFIDPNGGGAGVRLQAASKRSSSVVSATGSPKKKKTR